MDDNEVTRDIAKKKSLKLLEQSDRDITKLKADHDAALKRLMTNQRMLIKQLIDFGATSEEIGQVLLAARAGEQL